MNCFDLKIVKIISENGVIRQQNVFKLLEGFFDSLGTILCTLPTVSDCFLSLFYY